MDQIPDSKRFNQYQTRLWTPHQETKLRELCGLRLTAAEIGKTLGFTRNAISGKAFRLGITINSTSKYNHGNNDPNRGLGRKRGQRRYHKRALPLNLPKVARLQAALTAAVIDPLKISLINLEPIHCHQVVDGETDDSCMPLYCGHPVVHGSYCSAHAALNYIWGRR